MIPKTTVLNAIWSRSIGRNVFLPTSDRHGQWDEGYAMSVVEATERAPFMNGRAQNLYFSPLRYDGPRQKHFIGQPGVIFADLDGGHEQQPPLVPSVIVSTSAGHYHAYWFLNEPADPVDWEPRAKGWTRELGGDPGGWDTTQVLRIPSSLNLKHDPPASVSVQSFKPELTYDLDQFPAVPVLAVPWIAYPLIDKVRRDDLVYDGGLPLAARYWLTVKSRDLKALGTIDRSRIMWGLERSLLEAGYPAEDVFQLLMFSSVNKWADHPEKLWTEILKAKGA